MLPVLARAGCAAAACHAKQGGQSGFQLSVFSYDPEADHRAVVIQAGGRRLNRLDPGRSLLLLKATASLPHGGGQRFAAGTPEYRLVARWIAEGARFAAPGEASLTAVHVSPEERVLAGGGQQQLCATAHYSDGGRRDVTRLAEFHSNETRIAEVDASGLIHASRLAGETAVMVRYMGQVAVARITVPRPDRVPASAYRALQRHNFIDEHVNAKLARLDLLPSPPCDDATFLRRAYLDLIGTLPTVEETRAFLAECGGTDVWTYGSVREGNAERERLRPSVPQRPDARSSTLPPVHTSTRSLAARARLVERLLERPEYADYWGMRWVNLLLVDRDPLFPKGAFAYDRWVRDQFRANVPYDRFARSLVTAAGETYRDGPANFYRSLASPEERGKAVSQLFLGVRLDCAQCHHHPFERWGQDDFYAFAAYFARMRRKGSAEFEQVIYPAGEGEVNHPKSGKPVPPKPLGTPPEAISEGEDRRESLARWMTAPGNPYFARAIVNRVWGMLMGQGLVEPVDDLRVTNPASNEALLDALARDFVGHGFDLKHLLRTITASAAYQRSSAPTATNARDARNSSRYTPRRLVAEVLLDAIGQATGVPETFPGHPATTRAIQMWDNKLPVEFLEVFGRPSRLSVCECDRPAEGSVTQVLHLMNSPSLHDRLTAEEGTVARLEKSGKPPDEVVAELYLTAYSRFPTPEELTAARAAFSRPGATRRAAVEDLLWTLMNTPEFVFNH